MMLGIKMNLIRGNWNKNFRPVQAGYILYEEA